MELTSPQFSLIPFCLSGVSERATPWLRAEEAQEEPMHACSGPSPRSQLPAMSGRPSHSGAGGALGESSGWASAWCFHFSLTSGGARPFSVDEFVASLLGLRSVLSQPPPTLTVLQRARFDGIPSSHNPRPQFPDYTSLLQERGWKDREVEVCVGTLPL